MQGIKRYLQFVKPYRWLIVITIIIGVIKFGIPLIMPWLLKYIIDDVIQGGGSLQEKTSQLITAVGITFFIFAVLRPPIEYYRQYFAQRIGNTVLYDLRKHIFDHLQRLSLRYYSNTKTGEVISRVIHDVEQTKDFVITGLMNVWLDMATILIAVVVMFSMNIKLTLVALFILPIYAVAVKYFFSRLRKLTRVRSQALATMQGYLHERIQGMQVTRSFALEEYEQRQFEKRNNNFLTKALNHTSWTAKTFSAVNTLTDLGPLLVIVFAAYEVIHGKLTLGTMVAFVGYMDSLYSPLRRLVNSSTTLTQSFASMDRVFELLDEKYDIVNVDHAIQTKKLDGKVVFDDVSFRYNEKEADVLRHLSFTIAPGEKVALVGASGGGKSSIASLIPRFYDVSSGAVYIDDVNVKEYEMRNLRSHIGIVLQDNLLFSDTIRANILYGNPNATDEEVIAAARAAQIHDFILALPDGYYTIVGERGVKLSGGQRQRIAIARVFLKNPSLLILDEATSALDLENERYIQEALQTLAADRTTIIIAHRLATITHVDTIVYIENGEIKEKGSHEQLMEKRGLYYNLYQLQHIEETTPLR
ncbi:ABC transporter ATP-binding protein [Bacillus cytotoxicus]|uniref:ABC transporter-related protein n=2 Tax=Bacillus cytotoxicus TaxID=580165 RepID=A0AAX2CCA4_9BACI|nr:MULTISPECIES: ABC transporter ATP-binding protein [Bacillus cereus group]ABS20805.1 ABC transporter-related protein [Bacillus cytotoxicus NVH 391-98]AWC43543.1 ABC transporter ATP-binding protein [Bacillus cytotoxicus]MDH2865265.1 ABC transporter ATP-binding protein/permease [Bacillus cytotoxicus]MDH2885058.1 ABC transporter ATP-binding protein/permease [Bacillus cytotoxicus]NZD33683.1 ABC transporter ATP-binding protein [Bacillus cytotoxicus]